MPVVVYPTALPRPRKRVPASDDSGPWNFHICAELKMAEKGYSVDNYLHEKQMSMLDALSEGDVKPKRVRKPKAPKA